MDDLAPARGCCAGLTLMALTVVVIVVFCLVGLQVTRP